MEKHEELFISIRKIIRAIDIRSSKLAKEHGVTGPQLLILQELKKSGTLKSKELAEIVSLSRPTITHILDRLEAKSFIRRERDPNDKRSVLVSITTEGAQVLDKAPKALEQSFIDQFGALEDWEQSLLVSGIQRIAEMMGAKEIDAAPILDIGDLDSKSK